jgi:hypothetical protein
MNEKFVNIVKKRGYIISSNWNNGMIAVFDGGSGYLLINCYKYLDDNLEIDDIYIGVQIKDVDILRGMNEEEVFKYLRKQIKEKDLNLFYTTFDFLMKRQYKFMEDFFSPYILEELFFED